MTKDTNCQGCAVQQGTHKPSEALSAIADPKKLSDAIDLSERLEENTDLDAAVVCKLEHDAADMLRTLVNQAIEIEATHLRELAAYRTTVENLEAERSAIIAEKDDYKISLRAARAELAALKAAPAAQAVEPAAGAAQSGTVTYSDGTTATGPGSLPQVSPRQQRAAALIDSVEALLGGANGPTIQLRALLAAPAPAAVAVPDGWKLVPVQDTSAMWTAGGRAIKSCAGHERDAASLAYKAMLAAAPTLAATPPAQAQAAANTQEKTMPFNSPIYEGVRAAVQRDMHAGAAWHSDTVAVYRFADEMAAKMEQARAKGRGGWETCPPEVLSSMLREHVEKGDPRDVANFCMMLWHLGQPIAPAPQAQDVQRDADIQRAVLAERERICAAIKAEDDHCVTQGDYMLDSEDCIKVVRGEWVRPVYEIGSAAQKGGEA